MSWIRLEAAVFQDPKIRSLRPWGGLAWVAILTMSKLHGWAGVCPPEAITGAALADHLGLGEEAAEPLEKAIEGLLAANLLVPGDGALVVYTWKKYQPGRGSTERMRKLRAEAKARKEAKLHARDGVTRTTRTSDDVTGRDVTLKSESKTPVVASAVAVGSTTPGAPPPAATEPAPTDQATTGSATSGPGGNGTPAAAPAPAATDPGAPRPPKPCRYCLDTGHYPLDTPSCCKRCPKGQALVLVKRDGRDQDRAQADRAAAAARRADSAPAQAFDDGPGW